MGDNDTHKVDETPKDMKSKAVKTTTPEGESAFFYGTLMAPEVFFTVCYQIANPGAAIKSEHTFTPAVLSEHSRRRVKHADYPGVIPQKGHTVLGVLATGLTETNIFRLDWFEGSEYERRRERVRLQGKGDGKEGKKEGEGEEEGEEVEAWVYVFKNPQRLEHREWDFEEFRKEKMKNWTREGLAFDGCDPDDPATVKEEEQARIG